MRELREFRVLHDEFVAASVTVAGVSRESVESNQLWARRLQLPFPVLSDRDGALGARLGVTREIRVGAWKVQFLRRSTLLAGVDGRIAAVWSDVKVRGHARQVLDATRALKQPDRSLP